MPVLWEVQENGSVGSAADWSGLKVEIHDKLTGLGASDENAAELVRPLDDAVAHGEDFRTLIGELNSEFAEDAARAEPVLVAVEPETSEAPEASEVPETSEASEFEEGLPPADELAQAIVTDIGAELGRLIATDEEFASQVSEQELVAWVAEDVAAAIDEMAELGWTAQ